MKKYKITFYKKTASSSISIDIKVTAKTISEAQDKAGKSLDDIYGKAIIIGFGDLDINLLKNYIVSIDVLKNEKSPKNSKNEYII